MVTQNNDPVQKITIIGAGIIGCITALYLNNFNYEITIIDPDLNKENNKFKNLSGSQASLGILMGNIYNKSSGRSWRLRKRSMELWPKIINQINSNNQSIKIETPLIKLASSEKESNFMKQLANKKNIYDIEFIKNEMTFRLSKILNSMDYGALISHNDGRINSTKLMKLLVQYLKNNNVNQIKEQVISLHKIKYSNRNWKIYLCDGNTIENTQVIICAGLNSMKLLKTLGYNIELEPILGQALELEYNDNIFKTWPAVISTQGFNLIPKNHNTLIIGATLEPGISSKKDYLNKMISLNKNGPNWIKKGYIKRKWEGIRARPIGKPSPILEMLEPGLFINSGHYRNGFLLAPASAEWVANNINKL